MPIHALDPPRNVLLRHPLQVEGSVPHMGLIPRIRREVGGTRDRISAVDGWEQRQISSWVIHHATAGRKCVLVFTEPHPVVKHPAQQRLLRSAFAAAARDSAAIFPPSLAPTRERHFGKSRVLRLAVES